jgi:putative transcriptional regulator
MFGLGRPRSNFGKFLEKNGITQQELEEKSGVSQSTISRLCIGNSFKPSMRSATKIIKALRSFGTNADYDDFWM